MAVINAMSRVTGKTMHAIAMEATALGLKLSQEELGAEAGWAGNASSGRSGIPPCQAALGFIPRDPLDSADISEAAVMSPEEKLVERVRLRNVGIKTYQGGIMEERLEHLGKLHGVDGQRADEIKELSKGDWV